MINEMAHAKLPSGWTISKLSDVAVWGSGGTPSRKNTHYYEGSIPWIKTGELGPKIIRDTEEKISEEAVKNSSAKIFPAGSVGIAMYGATIGKLSILGVDASTNQACAVAQPYAKVLSNQFLYYFLLSEKNKLIELGKGGAQPNISQGILKEWPILLPPFEEQQRIVVKVEELFSELDKGIESLKTAREQLKVYRQAVLKHAFEGKLTAEWRKQRSRGQWKQTSFDFLLSYLTSGSRGWAKYYSDDGDIFIRAQNLKHDRLDLDDIAYVQLPEKSEGMRTRVQVGDLLITITGANVTKTAYVHKDLGNAYVSQHVALCRPKAIADTEFLYWYLIGESAGRKQLKELAYGAGKPGLNLDNIRSVKIQLPELDEQKVIVQKINELLSIEASLTSAIESEIQRAESLRQSILKKAFSGRLVPQDPNDEPASVLLERIRAEKAAQSINSRTRKRKPSKEVA